MKCLIANVMTTSLALGLGVAIAQAQNWTGSVPLGDVARQLRAQRAKSEQRPRVFTNDDLVALPTSGDQSAASPATSSSTTSKEAKPWEESAEQTSANQTGKEPAKATPAETGEETHGEKHHRDRVSKPPVRREGELKVTKISPSAVKLVKHPAPSTKHARMRAVRHGAASGLTRALAKTNPRPAPKVASRAGAPRQVNAASSSAQPSAAPRQIHAVSSSIQPPAAPHHTDAASSSAQPSARQDVGYVEKADGRVEAIVAEGEHVRLVQETKSFVRMFHVPASSPPNVEAARASPPPTNLPASPGPEVDAAYPSSSAYDASGSPSAAVEVDAALLRQPEPIPGVHGKSESGASAALQSEPLADYASDQSHAKPPETLQPTPCPILPALASEGGVNRSTVKTLGYVEKAGGEREAIVEVLDQVYLVHEGELFAEKYRALRVTPSSVEIVEESPEASFAPPERRRNSDSVDPPVSR